MTALRDGAMQLSDGLKQLNEEGFQKLVDAMDGDVEPLLERAARWPVSPATTRPIPAWTPQWTAA